MKHFRTMTEFILFICADGFCNVGNYIAGLLCIVAFYIMAVSDTKKEP